MVLMGREIREPDSKSTVNATRTPLRSGESAPLGGSGLTASPRGAWWVEVAALGRMDDGKKGGRIDGQLVEDRSEGRLQPVHCGPPRRARQRSSMSEGAGARPPGPGGRPSGPAPPPRPAVGSAAGHHRVR